MDLTSELILAFPDSRHPGNGNLLASNCGVDDCDIRFLYDSKDKMWFDLDYETLSRNGACLTSLSDIGLLFVIPAYLKMYSDGYEDPNGWVDRLLIVLSEKGRGGLALNAEQFRLIDQIFLSDLLKISIEFGRAGSVFGIRMMPLIRKIRKNYQKYRP